MSHPMLSYVEEVDVLEGLDRTVSTLQQHMRHAVPSFPLSQYEQ